MLIVVLSCLSWIENDLKRKRRIIALVSAVVMIPVFFHDVIYCARSGTSKEDSAACYRKFEMEL